MRPAETGRAYFAVANELGFYLMPALEPGQYRIMVQAEGMQPWKGQIVLRAGETAVTDVTL